VIVAVATLTPVEFQPGRGPVSVPCGAGLVETVQAIIAQTQQPCSLPDVYLVLQSTTGFREGLSRVDGPGWLTVLAEPWGTTWKTTVPATEGRPRHVRDFVHLLVPETAYRQRQRIRGWVETALDTEDFLTATKVQDGMEAAGERIGGDEVLNTFRRLEDSGRYVQFKLRDGQPAIRPATRAERAASWARRRKREAAATMAGVLGAFLAAVVFMWKTWQSLALGTILLIVVCQLASHIVGRLAALSKNE